MDAHAMAKLHDLVHTLLRKQRSFIQPRVTNYQHKTPTSAQPSPITTKRGGGNVNNRNPRLTTSKELESMIEKGMCYWCQER